MTSGARHLVVVGLSGVGKSTIARVAAAELGWVFVDTDELVEQIDGVSPSEIIRARGIEELRRIETIALGEALADERNSVIATGGGIVESTPSRQLLDAAPVVWLHAPVDAITARIASSRQDRPLLDGDPVAALAAMSERRTPWYESVADIRIPTDGRSVAEVVAAVVAALEEVE